MTIFYGVYKFCFIFLSNSYWFILKKIQHIQIIKFNKHYFPL